MGPRGCPETSVRNYHYTLRNNPEERSSHLLRGGSLKSRKILQVLTGYSSIRLKLVLQTQFYKPTTGSISYTA